MADYILKIDEKNSQVASLLATALSQWQSFDHKRQILMKEQLIRIHDSKHLSKDTYEVVSKSLAEAS
jgi:aminopeptidase N